MTDATSQTPSAESTQGPIADPPPGDVRPRGRVAAAIRAWGDAEGIPTGNIPLDGGHLTIQNPEDRFWFAYQEFQRDEAGSLIPSAWSLLRSEWTVREVSTPPPGDRVIIVQARPPVERGTAGESLCQYITPARPLQDLPQAVARIVTAERDRARATAVRLEQELAEMTEVATVAIGLAKASQARESELQDATAELIAKVMARNGEGHE